MQQPSLWFLLYFVLLWCAITWLLGRLTGWTFVAKAYPCQEQLPKLNRWNSCSIPNLTMRNCVNVALDEKGMYFQLFILFRLGNPAIFVPWSDINVTDSKILFFNTRKFTFKRTSEVSFQFYKRTADKFEVAAGTHWQGTPSHE